MTTPKPHNPELAKIESALDAKFEIPKNHDIIVMSGKPVPKVKKKPSAPVRNPAFRESEELRELQRKLHRNNRPSKK